MIDRSEVTISIPVQQLIQPKKLKSYLQLLPPELRYQMFLHLDIEEPGALTLLKYGVAVSDEQKFELGKKLLHLNLEYAKKIGNPILHEAQTHYLKHLEPMHKAIQENDIQVVRDYFETAIIWKPTELEISEIPKAALKRHRKAYHFMQNIVTALHKPLQMKEAAQRCGIEINKWINCPRLCTNITVSALILGGLLIYSAIAMPDGFDFIDCWNVLDSNCKDSSYMIDVPCNASAITFADCRIFCKNLANTNCTAQQQQYNKGVSTAINFAWMPLYITASALAFIQISLQLTGCWLKKHCQPMSPQMEAVIGEYESRLEEVKTTYKKELGYEEV